MAEITAIAIIVILLIIYGGKQERELLELLSHEQDEPDEEFDKLIDELIKEDI